MAENKKSFILYCDLLKSIEHLTNEEKGILFNHLLEYVNDKNPVLTDRLILTAWKPIEMQLKRDLSSYVETIEQKSQSGILGNLKRYNNDLYLRVISNELTIDEGAELAKARKVSHSDQVPSHPVAKLAVNDTDTVNDNDTVINKKEVNVPFDSFWDLYDKKVGDKDKLIKKWVALKDDERLKAMQHIPKYKESQPDKKYRKDPATYLNNKSFNDEIINSNSEDIFSNDKPTSGVYISGVTMAVLPNSYVVPNSNVYIPGVTVADHKKAISTQEQHRIWIANGEYWRIEYGHLAKTREEFDALMMAGEIS